VPTDLLLDIAEVKAALHVSRATVYRLIQRGHIRSIHIMDRRLVLRSSIDELISSGGTRDNSKE
jgi:excisionase family DNA binding protein